MLCLVDLSSIVITLLGKTELVALFFFGLWYVSTVCHGLFALPLIVIGRLSSLIVAIS